MCAVLAVWVSEERSEAAVSRTELIDKLLTHHLIWKEGWTRDELDKMPQAKLEEMAREVKL